MAKEGSIGSSSTYDKFEQCDGNVSGPAVSPVEQHIKFDGNRCLEMQGRDAECQNRKAWSGLFRMSL
jgi:hypothetical protein